jgi:hypothetical protein
MLAYTRYSLVGGGWRGLTRIMRDQNIFLFMEKLDQSSLHLLIKPWDRHVWAGDPPPSQAVALPKSYLADYSGPLHVAPDGCGK